jgi:hypothetical protein
MCPALALARAVSADSSLRTEIGLHGTGYAGAEPASRRTSLTEEQTGTGGTRRDARQSAHNPARARVLGEADLRLAWNRSEHSSPEAGAIGSTH